LVTFLPSCSIGSSAELGKGFYEHFCNETNEMMLSRLTSVRLGRDQSALDFVKGLRDIKKTDVSI
jgi:hypothetical protein